MTTAAGTRPTTEVVRTAAAPDTSDRRRITERDPDVARLRARTRARLTASLRAYVADLRRAFATPHGQARAGDATSAFIHRQVGILRDAYAAAHQEGVRDYWQGVSHRRPPHVDVDPRTERARMAFYAPSVAKMAHEARQAAQATVALADARLADARAEGRAEGYTLAAGDALSQWFVGVTARVNLQSDITWAGAQDGYVDGGAADGANPYALLYWDLEPLAKHCDTCPLYAAGSPYDPPWVAGGHHLNATPGDGSTECGAGCKCSLRYGAAAAGAAPGESPWSDPGATSPPAPPETEEDGAETSGEWPSFAPPTAAEGAPEDDADVPAFTGAQVDALDAYRAARDAWAAVRGDLPPLPPLFAAPNSQDQEALDQLRRGIVLPGGPLGDLPGAVGGDWVPWDELTAAQQRVLEGLYQALTDVAGAFPDAAAASLDDLSPDDLFLPGAGELAEWWEDDGAYLLAGHEPGYHGQGHDPKTGRWEPGEGHESGGGAKPRGTGKPTLHPNGARVIGETAPRGSKDYPYHYGSHEEARAARAAKDQERHAGDDQERLAAMRRGRQQIAKYEAAIHEAETRLETLRARVTEHLAARRAAGAHRGESAFMRKAGQVHRALKAFIAEHRAAIAAERAAMPESRARRRVADMTPEEYESWARAKGMLAELAWLSQWLDKSGIALGGHEPGYSQNRDAHGRWAPGDGRAAEHGAGHGLLAPHEATVRARGGGGGGGGGASGAAGRATVEYKGDAREALRARFGRDLTDEEVGALSLARAGDHVTVRGDIFTVEHADGSTTMVSLLSHDGGGTDIYNWLHASAAMRTSALVPGQRENGAPTDYGRLRDQMAAAQRLGIRGIGAKIGRGGDDWRLLPRMGYDARITAEPHEWKVALPPHLAHIERLSEAMATPEGRAWADASIWTPRLYFDLTPGSESLRMFEEYGRTHGAGGMDGGDMMRGREAPVTRRDPRFIEPYHEVEDTGKRDAIADDMRVNGYHGAPIVTAGDGMWAITGVHRLAAAQDAGLDRVPTVDLEDLFREDGKDFAALHAEYGSPTVTEPDFVPFVGELSPGIRAKYGIDLGI